MKRIIALIKKDNLNILDTLGINRSHEDYKEKLVILVFILFISIGLIMYYLQDLYIEMFTMGYEYVALLLGSRLAFGFLFLLDIYYLYECVESDEYLLTNSFPINNRLFIISKTCVLLGWNYLLELVVFLPLVCLSGFGPMMVDMAINYIMIPVIIVLLSSILLYIFINIGKRINLGLITKSLLGLLALSFGGILLFTGKINLSYINEIITIPKYFSQSCLVLIIYIIVSLVVSTIILENLTKLQFYNQKRGVRKKGRYKYKKKNKYIALLVDEFKRYLSDLSYVLNTGLGLVLILFFSINQYLVYRGYGIDLISIPQEIISSSIHIFPYIMALVVGTCSTAKVSLSIEGKCIWIKKMMPLKAIDIYGVKIIKDVLLLFPVSIISVTLIILPENLSSIEWSYIFLSLIINIMFLILLGIAIDIKFVNYNWKSSSSIIKRGASAIIYQIVNIIIMTLFIFLISKYKDSSVARIVFSLSVISASAYIYKWISNKPVPD